MPEPSVAVSTLVAFIQENADTADLDRTFAWTLRPGKAVLAGDEHITAGQLPTLSALPGCHSDQKRTAQHLIRPTRYGVNLRHRGEKTVRRLTHDGHITDDVS